ncbi:thiosulfate:glutathione sulfurtransferase, partial [Tremellales sp. Uapishka_1]
MIGLQLTGSPSSEARHLFGLGIAGRRRYCLLDIHILIKTSMASIRNASAVLGRMTLVAVRPTPLAARTFIIRAGPVLPSKLEQVRYKTTSTPRNAWAKEPMVSYEELKPITQQPTDDILIIDVREPDEVALGSIPSSVNLPLSTLKEALDSKTNAGDFQRKYAFTKPLPSQNIIFFCRSGKRSASAAEIAGDKGYPNVRNYVGSWLDWSKREKAEENDD